MANPLYARLQATADRLIKSYGQQGTVTRVVQSGPDYDPVLTATDYPAKLVPMKYDQRYIDGTNITTKDREIYISSAGLAVSPQVGDLVTDAGGTQYHIVNDDPNCYDGITNVVYVVQGRLV